MASVCCPSLVVIAPHPLSSHGLERLTELNLDDLFDAVGLGRWRHQALAAPVRGLLRPLARRFAGVVHQFDQEVGAHGLAAGSAWLVKQMSGGLAVAGLGHIPRQGPVFVLANHPGMTDTVALFACLAQRPDLKVIALERAFLRALPHVARHLIFVPDDEQGRMAVVRAGVRHLRQGGALLTFPGGEIEPDPQAHGAEPASAALSAWHDSHTVFTRLVPETLLVPAIVRNVISAEALRHPLTRLRGHQADQDKLAAALQVSWSAYQRRVVQVAFGQPLPADGASLETRHAALVEGARRLITQAPAAWSPVALQNAQVVLEPSLDSSLGEMLK